MENFTWKHACLCSYLNLHESTKDAHFLHLVPPLHHTDKGSIMVELLYTGSKFLRHTNLRFFTAAPHTMKLSLKNVSHYAAWPSRILGLRNVSARPNCENICSSKICLHLIFLSHTHTLAYTESGATVLTALRVLKEHGVKEEKIQLVTLFATPRAVRNVLTEFSDITLLTSEVHPCCPSSFGQKYFGSD